MRPTGYVFGAALVAAVAVAAPGATEAAPTLTTLHDFTDTPDGAAPVAGLIADSTGALYGTTQYGGASGGGTVFKLTPAAGVPWSESVLWSFSGSDGSELVAGLIADASGALYGTTRNGGSDNEGTAFQLVTAATFAGLQGQPDCVGKSASPLAQKYGGLSAAAAALGYADVQALQNAIKAYCAQ
jgi:uncharacterized repeat protein (TIGR03803 family)